MSNEDVEVPQSEDVDEPVSVMRGDLRAKNIDWLEFESIEGDEIRYRLHLPFLFSGWTCTYGNGCVGLIEVDSTTFAPDTGCCSHGAYMEDKDDYDRTNQWTGLLTEEDIDPKVLKEIRTKGWARVMNSDPDNFNVKTRVKDGVCIFSNRVNGPRSNKPGCSLLHMSARLSNEDVEDVDHTDTMPTVCWQLPFRKHTIDDAYGEPAESWIVPWHAPDWLPDNDDDINNMEWFCVDDTANYMVGNDPLFERSKSELRLMVGDDNWDMIYPMLKQRYQLAYVSQMPAVASPEGRSTIPLAIKNRMNLNQPNKKGSTE